MGAPASTELTRRAPPRSGRSRPGTSSSGRADAATPLAASAASASAGSRPRRRRALRIVLRRCANASSTTRQSAVLVDIDRRRARAGPAARRPSRPTDGARTPRAGRDGAVDAVARYATRRLTAPYASSPGRAASRSPTSRCSITTNAATLGTRVNTSRTSGVATLYGRFAQQTHGSSPGPSTSSQSKRVASARHDADRADVRRAPRRSAGTSARSNSIASTGRRRSSASAQRERPETRADLDHAVARGRRRRRATIAAREVRVEQEVSGRAPSTGATPWRPRVPERAGAEAGATS